MPVKPLPNTGAVSGLKETLDFFGDPSFAQRRFETYGDVFATKLLTQPIVFIRGERAINDLFRQSELLEGWWPESVKQLLGRRSLANRSGAGHKARRRVVGQLFSSAALARYTPSISGLVDELAEELTSAGGPVPLAGRMRRFAFAVIASTVLGLDPDRRDALFADFEIWTKALFDSLGDTGHTLCQSPGSSPAVAEAHQRCLEGGPQSRWPRSPQWWPG